MHARDKFLQGWERWGAKMLNYCRWFFIFLQKKIKDVKTRWQTVEDAIKKRDFERQLETRAICSNGIYFWSHLVPQCKWII